MKPVVKSATPAALAVLRQATALFPKRKKASDGLLPSAAHLKANPNSDHNTGLAVDLTHDPIGGVDCKEIFTKLKKDKRVKYLIFNGRIWQRGVGEKVYSGSNPHRSHLHISILDNHGNDVSPWFAWLMKETKKEAVKKVIKKKADPKPKKKYNIKKVRKKSILLSLFKKGKNEKAKQVKKKIKKA
jgi:hypothetical protein